MLIFFFTVTRIEFVLSKSAEKVSQAKSFFSPLRSFIKFTSSNTKPKEFYRKFNICIPSLSEPK